MTQPLPKWIMRRYAILWEKFRDKEFNYEKAVSFLKENQERVSVMLSDLKKYGWLKVNLDPRDSRKRIYKLKPLEKAVKEMAK